MTKPCDLRFFREKKNDKILVKNGAVCEPLYTENTAATKALQMPSLFICTEEHNGIYNVAV